MSSGVRLELVNWRTDVVPGLGTDPQAVINAQIGDNYDIFVGILWTRFGTPTPRASSGTEEEFEIARKKYDANPDSVQVMLYFKNAPIAPNSIDTTQLAAVNKFRKGVEKQGI